MTLEALCAAAKPHALTPRAIVHPDPKTVPRGIRTLVLLGPDEPTFWPHFTAQPEAQDSAPDPMDRWSRRVLDPIAQRFEGVAILPSDGPPYPAFISWALASGHVWQSPVGLLVHRHAGLFLSFRGAIGVPDLWPLSAPVPSPCTSCADKPCETACPVGALAAAQIYDVPRCKAHVRSPDGTACRTGCLARRICPAGLPLGRALDQSAFHMDAFLRN
ncbi:MAG: ferredoxin [Paracoccaceae bacterium]